MSQSGVCWHLYLVETAAGLLYTGVSTDVARRFREHQSNGFRCARSLRGKGPLTLVFSAPVGDRSMALRLEREVKRWPRARKQALIQGECPLPESR